MIGLCPFKPCDNDTHVYPALVNVDIDRPCEENRDVTGVDRYLRPRGERGVLFPSTFDWVWEGEEWCKGVCDCAWGH